MFKKLLYILPAMLVACSSGVKTTQVLLTAESGEKCTEVAPITFHKMENGKSSNGQSVHASPSQGAKGVFVDPDDQRQTIDGYGVSLTEASAFVLACLPESDRTAVLNEFFGADGANFAIVRTHIGASDFSVEGKYALGEAGEDFLYEDKRGFSREQYPAIQNEHYDLYHLIKDVVAIRQNNRTFEHSGQEIRILANTWTAPAYMKDNKAYYERGMRDGQWVSRGGKLLPEYYQPYADYLLRYLQAWREEGVEIWAMTPLNEPMGNDGGWESMEFSPANEAEFIAQNMGPTLAKNGFDHVKILGFDQNIFEMSPYTEAIYGDSVAKAYTTGMALHWYGSTFSCFPEVLDSIHALYPDKTLLHTEGCIDNLGCDAWDAVSDKEGFKESNWFGNDAFWWNNCATDWAYSTPYWPELHPAYSACQRYAQYIIEGMNHWMTGFIDWNMALDSVGGPNHVANYCGAPLMVNLNARSAASPDRAAASPQGGTEGGSGSGLYYTPYYYILKQFSRMIRPGDVALGVTETGNPDLFVSAVLKQNIEHSNHSGQKEIVINILNKSKEPIVFPLTIGEYSADITAPANSVMTFSVAL